ncbi:hypothetical protein ACIQUQ_04435 [Streptomyces sp. NPDC101118]|uniref:hypothetical protein n=1 Tax=Streptomyces sp. NPDC101118 TaxID=3366109 RepID=UPI0038073E35
MFAVIYRWRLVPGEEQQCTGGRHRVAEAVHARCGSYGSRLYTAHDGTWVAYARRPAAGTGRSAARPTPRGWR